MFVQGTLICNLAEQGLWGVPRIDPRTGAGVRDGEIYFVQFQSNTSTQVSFAISKLFYHLMWAQHLHFLSHHYLTSYHKHCVNFIQDPLWKCSPWSSLEAYFNSLQMAKIAKRQQKMAKNRITQWRWQDQTNVLDLCYFCFNPTAVFF